MRFLSPRFLCTVWLVVGSFASGEEERRPTAAVQGIKGVKEDTPVQIKNIQPGNAAPNGGITTRAPTGTQGVNKINGVETINGVKADGRIVPPTNPATTPPPPPIVPAGGTVVPASGGTVGAAATIQAVNGVTGINAAKLQNLEAALTLKQNGTGPPAGNGAEKGGKGRAAAAGLLVAPLGKKNNPKEDGRVGFQEFEKLQTTGS
jgi:hypothetical protein